MKISKQKLKQIGVVFSLLVLSNKEINSKEINNILNNVSETYIEIGNPEYGDYLRSVYNNLPEYIRNFLEENSMKIIVMPNSDDIENIYQDIYPRNIKNKNLTGLTIEEKLVALVEGCSHSDNIKKNLFVDRDYTDNQLNKFDLQYTMLHQIGHLVDIYYNYPSNSMYFLNTVYKNERKDFKYQLSQFYDDSNSIENVVEIFAYSFATYVLNPRFLKHYFPLAFNYMDELCNKMIEENKDKSK